MHFTSRVGNARRIRTGIGTAPGLSSGCYIQGINGIEIGDYTIIAPNVGLISANHSLYDYERHEIEAPIRIGRYCWIGMNAIVLPGVCIGDHTIVAAGAVVTKSHPEGYCVLAGNPARLVRHLERARVVENKNGYEYVGYHPLNGKSKEELYEQLNLVPVDASRDT